jgi:hypothetical protein
MGYFMRYFTTSQLPISPDLLNEVLKSIDGKYHLENTDLESLGRLTYADQFLGTLEFNSPDDEIFQDDRESFLDVLGKPVSEAENEVEQVLTAATALLVAEVYWEGTQAEEALKRFDPLWDWLFENRPGLLQADQEGFYNRGGLLVERRFTL